MTAARGVFITLEGGEGAGKSSMAHMLAADLSDYRYDIALTREPGWGHIGKAVRQVVLDDTSATLDPRTEALLFAADRAQHAAEFIRPALDRGALVICDRYIDSSVAYQGYARGLGPEQIAYLSAWGTADLVPDLTILIDLDPVVGIGRKQAQDETNRMEELDISFHQSVREGFLLQAAAHPDRFITVDGHRPFLEVYSDVLEAARNTLLP